LLVKVTTCFGLYLGHHQVPTIMYILESAKLCNSWQIVDTPSDLKYLP